MTEKQHPITPPPELVKEWWEDWHFKDKEFGQYMAERGAQWGADQELEACCEWLRSHDILEPAIDALRATRRPKPPSLKEQALEEIGAFEGMGTCNIDIIRRALEAIPDE